MNIPQLQECAILQVLGLTTCRTTQLCAEEHATLVIEAVFSAGKHRVAASEILYVTGINAHGEFMPRAREHVARVLYTIISRFVRTGRINLDKRQQIAYLVVCQGRYEPQLIQTHKRMFVGVKQYFVYLMR